jgi:hypothetical protein
MEPPFNLSKRDNIGQKGRKEIIKICSSNIAKKTRQL